MNRTIIHITGLLLLLSFGMGCENVVEPIADGGEDRFAIYGYLDMRSDRQHVRIERLRETILSEAADLGGLRVISLDEQTGSEQAWTDSTVLLSNGTFGDVFVSHFTPIIGHTYSLTIQKEGKTLAKAVAKIPEPPQIAFNDPSGGVEDASQHVIVSKPFDEPLNIFVTYVVVPGDGSGERAIQVPYGKPGTKTGLGWEFDVNLALDKYMLLNTLGIDTPVFDVGIRSATLEIIFLSPEWNDKTNTSNLVNAKGFLGSIGMMHQKWSLDSNIITLLGFTDRQTQN